MSNKVKRNFENYATRREAFLAYDEFSKKRNTPIWINDDEIPYAEVIDFNDWIWLPVQEKQAYRKSEFVQQYLGRRFV